MLIGTITKELEQEIERAVEDIYNPNTEEDLLERVSRLEEK
jgi:hypothetical protein